MAFNLPDLPYPTDALEPHIDAKTMEIHHDKHHGTYTTKLNDAVQGTELEGLSIEEILRKGAENLPAAVRNNGGGYYNHNLFWEWLSPQGGGEPTGELAEAIARDFGSFAAFKEKFSEAAANRFGSGWAWLVSENGKLSITSTPNQDNPMMEGKHAILGLDVWEHAYYLKYQNRRPEYIQAFWNVVNWPKVSELYAQTK
ncbi:superoxide dismutase [Truepera radiovictrix]|uniref:Superoxide dismutase n=1 Tax=Truepera radiovictrix (strain DSM 17093 / CIP 108686 / LMG 22925 / RQ-24) TaxID=649638 RepID=D7CSR0_TRURR|nr:superoxide dismutase [Truepera radiovictrix]ADI13677.1 Superoxide dismutase [Truepera radiovictrix DSM 17093]WMT57761.1 superoxide dismutase [Truepera radiovictrix]